MPHYWTALPEEGLTYESLGIARKKGNLGIALVNYAAYKGATELNGMHNITFNDYIHDLVIKRLSGRVWST